MEHIAVLGLGELISDDAVIAGVQALLGQLASLTAGGDIFVGGDITPKTDELDLNADIFSLFPGYEHGNKQHTRLGNALKRFGVNTVGELTAILDSEDGVEQLKKRKFIGDQSINLILEVLGRK